MGTEASVNISVLTTCFVGRMQVIAVSVKRKPPTVLHNVATRACADAQRHGSSRSLNLAAANPSPAAGRSWRPGCRNPDPGPGSCRSPGRYRPVCNRGIAGHQLFKKRLVHAAPRTRLNANLQD